jgi:predicted negative regulator of RcsB-dependent stress response
MKIYMQDLKVKCCFKLNTWLIMFYTISVVVLTTWNVWGANNVINHRAKDVSYLVFNDNMHVLYLQIPVRNSSVT